MDASLFPTKGNLMLAKNTLALSKQGYELLDKKRNILIREMMLLVDEAAELQQDISWGSRSRLHVCGARYMKEKAYISSQHTILRHCSEMKN